MLVLSRKIGGSIMIGVDIRLTVIEIRGKGVRIAVDAPRDVVILRDELARWPDPAAAPVIHPPPERPRPPGPSGVRRS